MQQPLRLDPEYNVALQFLGRAQFWLGHYDEAEVAFKERLVKVPGSDMTRAFLASLYGYTGQHQEARRLWQESQDINPDFSVERLRHVLPYVDTTWHDRFVNGLRRAGLDV